MLPFPTGHVILGKYEVTGSLGKGGMGFVLAATNLGTGELVALKFLHPSLRDDAELAARFDQEARTAIRIKNPHVARILDVARVDDAPFIVMERLLGEDLAAVLRRRGRLPEPEAIDLLLQTCEAIHDAHLLGIVHRDLKPSNLFLTTSAHGLPFLKVLDFGISKSTTADVSMTDSRAVMGSPRYMSPEQLASPRNVDARADVWSLGVILYEILCATPPFPGETYATVSSAIFAGVYAAPSSHAADVSPALEEVLAEALRVDRRKRIASVEALAANLAPFGTEESRLALARIESRSAYALVEQAAASATLANETTATSDVEQTLADAGTPLGVAESKVGLVPARRWERSTLVGGALVLVSAAAIVPYLVVHRAVPSVAAPASSSSAPAASASAECTGGATPACEAACLASVPGTCFELARGLEKGLGAPKDTARAATLYRAACDAKDGRACNSLGGLYARGDGVTHDDRAAVALYKSACDLHNGAGCVNLGTMHFEGTGVPKNEATGVEYFLTGCEEKEPLGCHSASVAFSRGAGVPKDLVQSYALAKQACDGGAALGCVRVAEATIAGEGVAKDVQGGLAQLDAACKPGATAACEALVGLYAKGLGTDVPASLVLSRLAAKKGCEAGSTRCCAVLSAERTMGATATTPALMTRGFEESCTKGNLVGCAMLGQSLVDGSAGTVDRAKGIALLKRACDGGVAVGCERLAAAKGK